MQPRWKPRTSRTISTRSRLGAIPALLIFPAFAATAYAEPARQATPPATSPGAPSATPGATPVTVGRILPVARIAILTGPARDAINPTGEEYEVYGTDLGHTFLYGDELYMIFGDTFGLNKTDWRSNAAAVINIDQDPGGGLIFDRMLTDRPGHAKELLPSKKIDFDEITVIPTYGVAVGDRLVLHYMSVAHWGPPGEWTLGAAGLAYSDDAGETWTKDEAAIWPGDSNFGQVSIVEHAGHLYLHGIPGGRFGGVHLARVAPERLLDFDAYEFWQGAAWDSDITSAATIVPAPVGELSVRWNPYYDTWVMMYLNEDRAAIVLRTADALTGPWSEEWIVATGREFPSLYAPYQFPLWNDGPEIYFTMSLFGPYQVYLMKTSLPEK
ncbi:MAG: DUF4185 domain-containing protein [Chloroflexota bacterium]|nr:DUF4185 domain-containing protein [Chloroflexota bacterium]